MFGLPESFSLGSAIGTPHVPLTGVGAQTPGLHHSPVILDQVGQPLVVPVC